jgi:hypothetical protein
MSLLAALLLGWSLVLVAAMFVVVLGGLVVATDR